MFKLFVHRRVPFAKSYSADFHQSASSSSASSSSITAGRLSGSAPSPRPAQRPLDTQERGVVIASCQFMADWLAHAVSQQDAQVVPEHRVPDG
jgi:hypothetical protein